MIFPSSYWASCEKKHGSNNANIVMASARRTTNANRPSLPCRTLPSPTLMAVDVAAADTWNGVIDGIVNDVDWEDSPERAPNANSNTLMRVCSFLLKSGNLSKDEVSKVKHIVLFQDERVATAMIEAEKKGVAALKLFLGTLPATGNASLTQHTDDSIVGGSCFRKRPTHFLNPHPLPTPLTFTGVPATNSAVTPSTAASASSSSMVQDGRSSASAAVSSDIRPVPAPGERRKSVGKRGRTPSFVVPVSASQATKTTKTVVADEPTAVHEPPVAVVVPQPTAAASGRLRPPTGTATGSANNANFMWVVTEQKRGDDAEDDDEDVGDGDDDDDDDDDDDEKGSNSMNVSLDSIGSAGSARPVPRRWLREEDESLKRAVEVHGPKHWKTIAMFVPGRNHVQCLQRWKKVLRPGLIKGHWTEREDRLLERLVSQDPKNWGQVSLHIPGRTAKQCRERWCNHLDPRIKKSEWTAEEDATLVRVHAEMGQKWAQIAKFLPGRTENAVKIRWKTLSRKAVSSVGGSDTPSPPTAARKKKDVGVAITVTSTPISVPAVKKVETLPIAGGGEGKAVGIGAASGASGGVAAAPTRKSGASSSRRHSIATVPGSSSSSSAFRGQLQQSIQQQAQLQQQQQQSLQQQSQQQQPQLQQPAQAPHRQQLPPRATQRHIDGNVAGGSSTAAASGVTNPAGSASYAHSRAPSPATLPTAELPHGGVPLYPMYPSSAAAGSMDPQHAFLVAAAKHQAQSMASVMPGVDPQQLSIKILQHMQQQHVQQQAQQQRHQASSSPLAAHHAAAMQYHQQAHLYASAAAHQQQQHQHPHHVPMHASVPYAVMLPPSLVDLVPSTTAGMPLGVSCSPSSAAAHDTSVGMGMPLGMLSTAVPSSAAASSDGRRGGPPGSSGVDTDQRPAGVDTRCVRGTPTVFGDRLSPAFGFSPSSFTTDFLDKGSHGGGGAVGASGGQGQHGAWSWIDSAVTHGDRDFMDMAYNAANSGLFSSAAHRPPALTSGTSLPSVAPSTIGPHLNEISELQNFLADNMHGDFVDLGFDADPMEHDDLFAGVDSRIHM